MDRRGALVGRPDPGGFRCLSCRAYVTGTPSGHCPKCGWVPPVAPPVPPEPSPGLALLSGKLPPLVLVLVVVCMLGILVIALLG